MGISLWIAAAACVVAALLYRKWPRYSRNAPLAPKFFPILGNTIEYLRNEHRVLDYMTEVVKGFQGRPFQYRLLGQPLFVILTDPVSIKHVLNDNFNNYVKGAVIRERATELLGYGIFNVDGDMWYDQRKIASNIFKRDELSGFMTKVFVDHGHIAQQMMEKYAASGEEFDLQDFFYRFTLESIGKIAFGTSFGCLESGYSEFASYFDLSQRIINERFLDPVWELRKHISMIHPDEIKLRRAVKILDAQAAKIIEERRKVSDLHTRQDILSLFMQKTHTDGSHFTDTELRDVVMSFIIAGRDTTAACLTWCFHELSQHPDIEHRIVEEINNVLGDNNDPSYDNVNNDMPYLHATIKETLRLHPSVPKDMKTAVADDILPDGTHIPAGATVGYTPYCMGRLDSLWPEASKFNPDRWMNNDPEPSQYKFIAFNAGPRLCLGQRMAYVEAEMLTVMLLQRFKFTASPGQTNDYVNSLTLQKKNGLKVRVQRR